MAGRPSLPTEFYDTTSAKMLIEPQPQWPHAKMLMAAINAKLDAESNQSLDIGRPAIPRRNGEYIQLDEMQLNMFNQEISSEAVLVVPDFRPGSMTPGHVVRMNRPKFQTTTYTQASREIASGKVISKVPVNVGQTQASLTVKRYAGPYNTATSDVGPVALPRFDASRSIHDYTKINGLYLLQDFTATMDGFMVKLFDAVDSANVLYPVGMTADTDSHVAGDYPMSLELVRRTEQKMNEGNIPKFAATNRRIMVMTPQQAAQLQGDSDYTTLAKYHPEFNVLYQGAYVGTVCGFDILQSNTLSVVNNGNSPNIPIHYAQAFGPGMVGVGPAGVPSVEPNTDDNYGQDLLAIWIFFCAFGTLDGRFGYSLHTS